VIRRACQLFDQVVVGVGVANGKNPLFTVDERVALLRQVCRDLAQVEICSFDGLSVDFARSKGAKVLVRGIRSSSDYAYEVQMALMNRAMAPEIETIFIPTSPEYSHISSTLAKEIAIHGGDTALLVPDIVAKQLNQILIKQRK
jgi:pantetheine-phosphate adenylyltransferase